MYPVKNEICLQLYSITGVESLSEYRQICKILSQITVRLTSRTCWKACLFIFSRNSSRVIPAEFTRMVGGKCGVLGPSSEFAELDSSFS